jgi:hypothetical protein
MSKLPRPRHGTIVAYLALFIALGGTSYALTVNSEDVPKDALSGKDIENLTIRDFKSTELPLQVVTGNKVTIGADGAGIGLAGCPDGIPTGGGYAGSVSGHVSASHPLANAWYIQVAGAPQGASFTPYAVCSD